MFHPPQKKLLTLVWLDTDLRLTDHPALFVAAQRGRVLPVYVHVPDEHGPWAPGSARMWWLHESLKVLDAHLRLRGSRLTIRKGANSLDLLIHLIKETGANAVYWNRRYEPHLASRDQMVSQMLNQFGIDTELFDANLLVSPDHLLTRANKPYSVFTPFWHRLKDTNDILPPLPAPDTLPAPLQWPVSVPPEDLMRHPRSPNTSVYSDIWTPGLRGAQEQLASALDSRLESYGTNRHLPGILGSSRLSPHLAHGEVSVREVWHAIEHHPSSEDREAFRRQLAWRDFAYYILHHHPDTSTDPLKEEFRAFPWVDNLDHLHQWQRGETGYPLVDAGMRQLRQTGWMHNRVRMIVASFLTKHLRIDWTKGAAWFWDRLVDADLANNSMGWQWSAGCGADAQPYFRIFNPVLQGKKFDPEGTYVRRWVPELKRLPIRYLHEPWTAPQAVLREAQIQPGTTYPFPVVDHQTARHQALEAYSQMKESAAPSSLAGVHGL